MQQEILVSKVLTDLVEAKPSGVPVNFDEVIAKYKLQVPDQRWVRNRLTDRGWIENASTCYIRVTDLGFKMSKDNA